MAKPQELKEFVDGLGKTGSSITFDESVLAWPGLAMGIRTSKIAVTSSKAQITLFIPRLNGPSSVIRPLKKLVFDGRTVHRVRGFRVTQDDETFLLFDWVDVGRAARIATTGTYSTVIDLRLVREYHKNEQPIEFGPIVTDRKWELNGRRLLLP